MGKRVLITGVGGAIGVHVMSYFLEKTDWKIVGLDSFKHKGYPERITEALSEHPEWSSRLAIHTQDLCCPISPKLAEQIGKIDYILHLAAMSDVPFSVDNPTYVAVNNVVSTLMMLEYAKTYRPEIFLYFSTDEVYGATEVDKAHAEWSPHLPSNTYSASKAASEDFCFAEWRTNDLALVLTNTMNNFAPMQSPSKFPVMIQTKLQNGETVDIHSDTEQIGTRFYIHSRDVADALLWILKRGAYHHQIGQLDKPHRYHIIGEQYDNLEFAQIIAKLMGKELDYRMVDFHKDNPAHDIHYGMEDHNLQPAGWVPPLGVERGLEQTIKWQQEHPQWLQ